MKDNIINLGDRRTDKTRKASDWSPEECVRKALASVSAGGEFAEAKGVVVIVAHKDEDGDMTASFFAAAPNRLILYGMLAEAMGSVQESE